MIPNKAFQALACGTPLVTADTPAARELLVDGESALLVPPGDPEALAAALRRLAADPELARRLSSGGLAAYREHASEDVLGARWRGLLEALAVRPKRAALAGDRRVRGRLRRARRSLRHRAFNTGRFDLGNMVQAVWNTAHGHFLQVTNLAGEQTSRLGRALRPDPRGVRAALAGSGRARTCSLVVQAVAVALGALPVFWLARKHLGSRARGARLRARLPALPGDRVARR